MALSRRRCVVWLLATIALGLGSRAFPLPGVFAEYTGDALYAVAVLLALACLRPTAPTWALGAAAWALCAAIECSQRLDWPWLVQWRATRIGALLLGQGWKPADLLAYAIGVLAAGALMHRQRRPPAHRRGP